VQVSHLLSIRGGNGNKSRRNPVVMAAVLAAQEISVFLDSTLALFCVSQNEQVVSISILTIKQCSFFVP
jgi:hypothetical protein